MVDINKELEELENIFLSAKEFSNEIFNDKQSISVEYEEQFKKFIKNFQEKNCIIDSLIQKNKKSIDKAIIQKKDIIESDFFELCSTFFNYCDVMWHQLIINMGTQLEESKKQLTEIEELKKKNEGMTKEFLTSMALFIALFSVINVNTNLFNGNLNIYMVVITNLTILLAISVIFAFVFQIFDQKPRKTEQKSDEKRYSFIKKFFKEGFFRIIISGLIVALISTLIIYGIHNSIENDINNQSENSFISTLVQSSSSFNSTNDYLSNIENTMSN